MNEVNRYVNIPLESGGFKLLTERVILVGDVWNQIRVNMIILKALKKVIATVHFVIFIIYLL